MYSGSYGIAFLSSYATSDCNDRGNFLSTIWLSTEASVKGSARSAQGSCPRS